MTQITLTPMDIVLGLLVAALVGALAGYALRWWMELRRESTPGWGERSRATPNPEIYGERTRLTRPPGRAESSFPGVPGAPGRAADPWRQETPADVERDDAPPAGWPAGDPGQTTVLVVDDRMELRAVHSAYLRQHGYRVLTAADGEKALAMVREHNPAVVVLDHSLPGRTGVEVTREMKRDPRTARIPVILMTAHSYGAIGMAAKQAGVAAFLPKPVDPSRVLREVERHARVDLHDA